MMDKNQLRKLISDVLFELGKCSEQAVNLLMGTAAQESALGKYWFQIKGPALGIFQMEPATEFDIWENFINLSGKTKMVMSELGYQCPDTKRLQFDLRYQIIMARLHYLRVKEALPSDLQGMARYWKKYYNTEFGKGAAEEFVKNFERYVG